MKTITKITTAFIVCTLFFTACGKDEDSQAFKEKKLKTIEVKDEKADTIVGTFYYFYDTEDRIAKIGSTDSDQNEAFSIEFTYNNANNVENIRFISGIEFTDHTFTYAANSKVPTKLTYSGSVPTYTTDITNNNGSLSWKDNQGDDYILENANFDNNTFESLNLKTVNIKFKENNQLKNGLTQKQDIIKLPLLMTSLPILDFLAYASLQISSKPIESIETNMGQVFNYQFEKDATGYITKAKNAANNDAIIAVFHYQ